MESQNICAVCGENAVHKCSACESVYYCNKEHQKGHWKNHATVCKSFKIAENRTLGRYYVATRNIKVGEIILKDDRPLVAGPMPNSTPMCLRCYTVLHKHTAQPCAKCGWPLCKHCTNHGSECEFTVSRRGDKVSITEFGLAHPSYQCINVIRALSLKNTSPKSYQKLLSFESHSDRAEDKESSAFEKPLNVVRFIKRFFKTDDIPEDEILKIVGIIQVNGHEVPLTEPPYIAVYELASLLEHSCKANCSKSFTDEGGLIIHAAIPIAKGDNISISYTDSLWGTVNRRHHLLESKFFECICDRCKDPTEFGTMFNAIKCDQTGCSGYALPKTFLDKKQRDYICRNCSSTMSSEKVEDLLEKIGIELSRMKKNDIGSCKKFLNRYKNVLHPNHFYNTDVTIALVQLIDENEGVEVGDNLLMEKIELSKKLDNLLKIIAPAENRTRGVILFEMHAALVQFVRRHGGDADVVTLLLESKKGLMEAYQLLKREPEILPEGKIARQVEQNLQKLNEILKHFNEVS